MHMRKVTPKENASSVCKRSLDIADFLPTPETFKRRAELVERGFALVLDRGGMRRAWLRGRENLRERYLVHVAGYNLGLVMRLLVGAGTPREFLARASAHLLAFAPADDAALVVLIVATGTEAAMLIVSFEPELHG